MGDFTVHDNAGRLECRMLIEADVTTLHLDSSPDSDHSYSGITFDVTAGENLTIGQAIYLKDDGKFWKAKADAVGTIGGFLMVATESITANTTGIALWRGFIRDDSWAWTTGSDGFMPGVFISDATAGLITETKPTASGSYEAQIGNAWTSDILFINCDVFVHGIP